MTKELTTEQKYIETIKRSVEIVERQNTFIVSCNGAQRTYLHNSKIGRELKEILYDKEDKTDNKLFELIKRMFNIY